MPGIDQMTIEIKPPMNPDGAEAVLGFMVSEAEKATQLPAISGIILRDEPTEEVVGPGEWMPMLTRNDDAIGLVIPDVGIVATVMPNGRYSLGSTKNGDEATVQNAKDTIEQGFVVCGNKYDYHHETTRHITAEVVGDVEFKNYTCFHLHHLTNRDDFFDTCTWTTRTLAKSRYDSYVAGNIPCSLCGILPGGVPVLLKSYDPKKETKP